jgi:glycosyltransferase involved in cell wall biosynthesis
MAEPQVSVIITTHNRRHLLPRAVESVLAQTFREFELIVVDDASTDDTPSVLREYRDVPNLRTARIAQSRGANHARNVGLSLSSGALLAYLDDDDRWLPRKLELQVEAFRAHPEIVLVGCGFRKRGKVHKPPVEVPHSALLQGNLLGGFSMCMFPRDVVLLVGCMDETLGNSQDWDLWLRLSAQGRVICISECLVEYDAVHPNRISSRANLESHYANYLRVVKRFEHRMPPWTRLKHNLVVRYHLTPANRPLLRFFRGVCYSLTLAFHALVGKHRRTSSLLPRVLSGKG